AQRQGHEDDRVQHQQQPDTDPGTDHSPTRGRGEVDGESPGDPHRAGDHAQPHKHSTLMKWCCGFVLAVHHPTLWHPPAQQMAPTGSVPTPTKKAPGPPTPTASSFPRAMSGSTAATLVLTEDWDVM